MKLFTILLLPLTITACDGSYRNSPKQQVEDMEICRKGGMDAYQTLDGQILCSPKPEEYENAL